MAKELIKGFDYDIKKDFLESKKLKDSSRDNCIDILNVMTKIENKCNCCIFDLDEEKTKDFVSKISPTSIPSLNYYTASYFDYYSKKTGKSVSNNICPLLKNNDIVALSYKNRMNNFITSLDELFEIFEKVKISSVDKLITILSYMGMSAKDIAELKVENVNLRKGELKHKEVLYNNIDERIIMVIENNIFNVHDKSEPLLKMQDNNAIGKRYVNSCFGNLKRKTKKIGLNKKITSKGLSKAGMLAYYNGHQEEFELEDSTEKKRRMIMLYRIFGFMEKGSPGRFTTCNDEFKLRIDIFKDNAVNKSKYFNAYTEVTDEEVEMVTKYLNSSNKIEKAEGKNLLESKCKTHGEQAKNGDVDDNSNDEWYKKQKEIGNKNENLVIAKLKGFPSVSDVEPMKDFSGFDIRYKLEGVTRRIEVKTLNKDLEFYISLNEINSIFNEQKSNYSIALVNGDKIKVIEDTKFFMGLCREYIYRLESNKFMEMLSESFVIRLKPGFYYHLKSLKEFIRANLTQ